MTDKDRFLAVIFVASFFFFGCWCGGMVGYAICEQGQIEAGRAYWWCDPQTGIKELKWKELCK